MEALDKVNEKLDVIINLLRSQQSGDVTVPRGSHKLTFKPDGTVAGVFRVMTDPKQWTSGKGMFLDCKVDGGDTDNWYSIALTYNVANKVSAGYSPKKGDTVAVSGKYEEKTVNDKVYRSIFAFRATPDSSAPVTPSKPAFKENEDVPF